MKVLITGGSGFIGMNLIERLLEHKEIDILNVDNMCPKIPGHSRIWKKTDILDKAAVLDIFAGFKPDAVIHLAARTDTDPNNSLGDYLVNTAGSQNIIEAICGNLEIKRAIFTSTQFVNQYNGVPKDDMDFAPHTVYGESKVIMEKMIRDAGLRCTWTIIRPTNIWGPWHIRYPFEFWKVLCKGLYFHPGGKAVIRSYGYVGNVVAQIISILTAPVEKVNAKVYYVGDVPIDIYKWVNGFSLAQVGKPVRVLPRFFLRIIALAGDCLSIIKIKFPLTSSRYKSMTNSNAVPMDKTIQDLGKPPYTLEQGIAETISWMRKTHPHLVKI